MQFIADFHIHSHYSMATSKNMSLPVIRHYAKQKGITLAGTGDFTHPVWFKELKDYLKPEGTGLFVPKDTSRSAGQDTHFILTAEVCNIFYQKGRAKKIHLLIFAPSFKAVDKLNKEFAKYGKLSSDGRPILNLPAKNILEIVLKTDPACFIVPAHIWTPWFGLFGKNSGFDDIEECFEDMTKYIFALETGLSSDPGMNWRWSKLDRFTLISNSDAHSPAKLGREANIFNTELDYYKILDALKTKNKAKLLATIEFFPQEGKYYWDGHRLCNVSQSHKDSITNNNMCPVCHKPLTIGVMHRIETLSDRHDGFTPGNAIPYYSVVPLIELIAQVQEKSVNSIYVKNELDRLISSIGSEFDILINIPEEGLYHKLPKELAEAVISIRNNHVKITPGSDGVFGKVQAELAKKDSQMQLF